MAIGRPRRFAREDVLKVAAFRADGLSLRQIAGLLGTSAGRVHDLINGRRPAARDPDTWALLGGDETVDLLFQKAAAIGRDPAAPSGAPGPGRAAARAGRGTPEARVESKRLSAKVSVTRFAQGRSESRPPRGRCQHGEHSAKGRFVRSDGRWHPCCPACVRRLRGMAHGPGRYLEATRYGMYLAPEETGR